jgi:hypothetical protein
MIKKIDLLIFLSIQGGKKKREQTGRNGRS